MGHDMLRFCLFLFVLASAHAAAAQSSAPQVEVAAPSLQAPVVDAPNLGIGSEMASPVVPNGSTAAATDSITLGESNVAQSSELLPMEQLSEAATKAQKFLSDGGPSIWAIAALSVITLALILWKIWRLALLGAWSRGKARKAVAHFENQDFANALATVERRRGVRSKVVHAAIRAIRDMSEDNAREETTRVAKRELADAASGLRALELIATIAPLLGLLGTVLGMIAAFQALQEAGSRADPALLAGGIWEALLTTAAGMAVAIPASAALTWFEAIIDRMRRDVEDGVTRIFVSNHPMDLRLAAE